VDLADEFTKMIGNARFPGKRTVIKASDEFWEVVNLKR
jgi:hypothetical protein